MSGLSRRRVAFLLGAAGGSLALGAGGARATALAVRKLAIVPFLSAPFPYHGRLPGSATDFLDVHEAGRRGHTSPRGGIYWEDQTYSDNRVLLALPKRFDPAGKPAIVVYFHGNNASLEPDVVGRQAVVDQLEASGLNAALVAPQFAVDALDSSAGRFWERGAFSAFMKEAANRLAALYGASGLAKTFRSGPIVLIAYSGGYDPAAFVLANGDERTRIRGVVLLDAIFGETDKFADWIVRHRRTGFLVSAYSPASADGNESLRRALSSRGIDIAQALPMKIRAGTVSIFGVPDADHDDFVTQAWAQWPIADLLSRTY